jgi:ribosomal protein L7Ae-like RNA K-turn-binding protein
MKKVYGLLGMAARAGKISSGTMAAKSSMISRRACLLVISNDIAPASRDSLMSACQRAKIPWVEVGDKYELGNAVGKAYRVALTVNDEGIAGALIKRIKEAEAAKSMGVDEWRK